MGMEHVRNCYWRQEEMCRHPRIGNSPAPEERCNQCAHFKAPMYVPVSVPAVRNSPPSLVNRAVSWVRAESSLVTHQPLTNEEYLLRLEVCNACPHLRRADEPEKLGWCTKCGCPEWNRSELTVKARMPASTCPLSKWTPDSEKAPLTDTLRGAINA